MAGELFSTSCCGQPQQIWENKILYQFEESPQCCDKERHRYSGGVSGFSQNTYKKNAIFSLAILNRCYKNQIKKNLRI